MVRYWDVSEDNHPISIWISNSYRAVGPSTYRVLLLVGETPAFLYAFKSLCDMVTSGCVVLPAPLSCILALNSARFLCLGIMEGVIIAMPKSNYIRRCH